MIDSTAVRETRACSGAEERAPDELADHALGRSHGGLTTKKSKAPRRQRNTVALDKAQAWLTQTV